MSGVHSQGLRAALTATANTHTQRSKFSKKTRKTALFNRDVEEILAVLESDEGQKRKLCRMLAQNAAVSMSPHTHMNIHNMSKRDERGGQNGGTDSNYDTDIDRGIYENMCGIETQAQMLVLHGDAFVKCVYKPPESS
jgi:hypothetical protein